MKIHQAVLAAFSLSFLMAAASPIAHAQGKPLPPVVEKLFRGFDKASVTEEPGKVVLLVMKRPVATYAMASSAYTLMCSDVYNNEKKAWGGRDFTRLEVRNNNQAQGFSFPASKADCMVMADMNMEQQKAHEKKVAWVCVAGNECRPRRPGEVTSGDQ